MSERAPIVLWLLLVLIFTGMIFLASGGWR
jgi:hypothetical protein